ncbi:MAG TPA: hypothetical protein VLX92_10555 [Kofleriaceae bacterium]|nr:hypothetical protein [Kofleriaceae bacterium]
MVLARRNLAYLVVAACSHPPAAAPPALDHGLTTHAALAADDDPPPPYGDAELARALDAERAALARQADRVAALEADPAGDDVAARADLEVERRFVAALERCRRAHAGCPPRLDAPAWSYDVDGTADPQLDTPLRFDLADWQRIAAELHGRACACRTLACVDSLGAAIDVLERRPMPEVAGDEAASASITRARECLFWLRGKAIARQLPEEP